MNFRENPINSHSNPINIPAKKTIQMMALQVQLKMVPEPGINLSPPLLTAYKARKHETF